MSAVLAIPQSGVAAVGAAGRALPTRPRRRRNAETPETASSGGVVYAFRQRGAPADEEELDALDPDRAARRRSPAWDAPRQPPLLSPDHVALPERLAEFHEGSALEAQLVTPALQRVHAAVMARGTR